MDAEQAGETTTQADQTSKSLDSTQSEPRPENATVERNSTVGKGRANTKTASQGNRMLRRLGLMALLTVSGFGGGLWLWPRILLALHTVSTDDAYVAGHVTYIAPRIPGTILKIHVDDNQFVNKGQLIVELDPEPYQIGADRAAAALAVGMAQVQQAETQSRAKVTEPPTGPFAGQKLQRSVQPTSDRGGSALPVPPRVGPTGATATPLEAGETIPIARGPSS